jgi:hypothetical protein
MTLEPPLCRFEKRVLDPVESLLLSAIVKEADKEKITSVGRKSWAIFVVFGIDAGNVLVQVDRCGPTATSVGENHIKVPLAVAAGTIRLEEEISPIGGDKRITVTNARVDQRPEIFHLRWLAGLLRAYPPYIKASLPTGTIRFNIGSSVCCLRVLTFVVGRGVYWSRKD